jgi:hypothetical protein
MRNLFPNIGREASWHTDQGKIESGRFLWLAASPEMRAQIFTPEIARDAGRELLPGRFKPVLSEHVWQEIRDFSLGPDTLSASEADRQSPLIPTLTRCLDLAREFVHPPYASRTDMPPYKNWNRISSTLELLSEVALLRMQDAIGYGLRLSREVAKSDSQIISQLRIQFTKPEYAPLRAVASLLEEMDRVNRLS